MDGGEDFGRLAIGLVILEKLLSGFFVERALWIRIDQQAPNHEQNLLDCSVRTPVLFQRVHADLTALRYVRVEDLC